MIVNPKSLIEGNSVVHVAENQIQPNSLDLTVQTIYSVEGRGKLTKAKSHLPTYKPLETIVLLNTLEALYQLAGNDCYLVEFDQHIKVPSGMVGFITHRSSLNRMGATILSGLYDSGFEGQIGAMIYPSKNIDIEVGARIATIYFIKAEESHLYSGQFQGRSK